MDQFLTFARPLGPLILEADQVLVGLVTVLASMDPLLTFARPLGPLILEADQLLVGLVTVLASTRFSHYRDCSRLGHSHGLHYYSLGLQASFNLGLRGYSLDLYDLP